MELLIIKSGKDYIRVKADSYTLCQLDKASVFPMDKLEEVKTHTQILRDKGFHCVSISRLKLSEEPFENHDI
ncbi:MAG: hypothetical protein PVJ84_14375 [Desulfobacteraceae bacterium]|jgi:hypothetical protein